MMLGLLTVFFCFQSIELSFAQCPKVVKEEDLQHHCRAKFQFLGLSPTQGQILEPVTYRYHVEHLASCKSEVHSPRALARNCSHSVLSETTIILEDGKELLSTELEVVCVYSYTGFFYTQPIELTISHFGVRETLVLDDFYTLEISALDPRLTPSPEMPLLSWRNRLPSAIFWIFAFVIVAGLSFYPMYRRQRILQAAAAAAPAPEISPLEQFYQQISYLLKLEPQSIEEQKNYYDVLSAALRHYIAKRLGLAALEATSSQIGKMLLETHVPKACRAQCQRILSESDYVKFGLSTPSQANNLALLRDTRKLVTCLEDFAKAREVEIQAAEIADKQNTKRPQTTKHTTSGTAPLQPSDTQAPFGLEEALNDAPRSSLQVDTAFDDDQSLDLLGQKSGLNNADWAEYASSSDEAQRP